MLRVSIQGVYDFGGTRPRPLLQKTTTLITDFTDSRYLYYVGVEFEALYYNKQFLSTLMIIPINIIRWLPIKTCVMFRNEFLYMYLRTL